MNNYMNNFINNYISKSIKGFIFLTKVLYIFLTEILFYYVTKDYSSSINNLTKRLASINILYVKIFQALALNNSLIDDNINNKLLSFTDNAPWNYSDVNLHDLVEIADKYNLYLKSGYEKPINSGMISLVFKAYKDITMKTPVIIKIKRKNIDKILNDAIENLTFCLYILSFIPILHKYQIIDVINNNIDIIKHQTNFFEEINNMDRIRENCKNLKYIIIPKAVRKVTEEYPNIILMDFIDGIKINQIEECDRIGFAKPIIKFGLVSAIIHGVTHGDLHSGNILFIKDKNDIKYQHKIGLIDFGIIYNIGNEYKNLMFDIFTQMFELSPRESAEKILNSKIIKPDGIMKMLKNENYNNILSFTEEIIGETIKSSNKVNQIQIYKFMTKLREYLSTEELCNIGIRPSDDFIKSQLVIAMCHGVTMTLCKENFMQLVDICINEVFNTKLLM